MPRFTLQLSRMVSQTALHDIEAADAEAAEAIAGEVETQLRLRVFPVAVDWSESRATDPTVAVLPAADRKD